PQILQKHGFRTGMIGKWHLGMKPEYHPSQLGFDHFTGFLSGGNRPMNPTLEVGGENVKMKGPLPDLLVDDAIKFIRESRDRPFALCLHFRAPHLPYGPVPKVDSEPYKNLDPDVPIPPGGVAKIIKRWNRDYYASISSVDRNIGRLLDELDRLKLTENTLVIFTSDHGYNNGRHGVNTKGNGHWIAGGVNGPKRPNMWETSILVPLVMRWPAVIKPGTQIDEMVSNIDMFRTMLGVLSVPMPQGVTVHGLDYSPLLRGETLKSRKVLFGQYDLHNNGLAYMRMIRSKRYKYVRHFKTNFMDELYDLRTDPDEKRNLLKGRRAGKSKTIAGELRTQLHQWQKSIDDPLLKSSY
ncbi:MAG: sulfatase-like hydrolase/transferase, partial [Planctomycetes bacterium]|nr:sulfatase-like hydrolase/transferase [Planctomycetota bacterium]